MIVRHFLSLTDLTADEVRQITRRANKLKCAVKTRLHGDLLRNRTMVLVFEKSSTRTRVSFETGMTQFGGSSIFLAPGDSHLSRGEPICDTARVLSRMADLIVMRTGDHSRIEEMAAHAHVPVINALSDFCHPCQQLADIQTFEQHRGDISGHKVAWVGDGNNVCHSWMNAARLLKFELAVATPKGYEPDANHYHQCAEYISCGNDPQVAVKDAALVVTDTWASMGQEDEKSLRYQSFAGFCVNQALMDKAAHNALFMHCLPAYRGYEVSDEVLEGPQSVVWDEAENRLHAQKALIEFLINQSDA